MVQRPFDALGWITELADVSSETGNCLIVKNRETAHYDALLVGHLDTVFPPERPPGAPSAEMNTALTDWAFWI